MSLDITLLSPEVRKAFLDLQAENGRLQFLLKLREEQLKMRDIRQWGPKADKLSENQLALLPQELIVAAPEVEREAEVTEKQKQVESVPKAKPAHLERREKIISCHPSDCACSTCGQPRPFIGYEVREELGCKPAEFFVWVIKREKLGPHLDDPRFEGSHYRFAFCLAQIQSLSRGQVLCPCLAFDVIKQADLSEDFHRQRVQGLEFADVGKFPTDVCHAGNERNAFSQLIVRGIAITLKFTPEWFEELSGAGFSSPTHLEIEDHRSSRSTVFPQVRGVILPLLFRGLARYRGFVGLEIMTGKQFSRLGFNHRHQQLSGSQNAIVESLAAQVDAMVFQGTGTLTVHRIVLLKLGRQHFNDELVGKFAPGKNLRRGRCYCHTLYCLAIRQDRPPVDALSKACDYALGQWSRIEEYLTDGQVEIDNNWCEGAMRPIALGRRNWLHLGDESAGPKIAAIISIVETCRRLDIKLREYLGDVLPKLGNWPITRVAELTPTAWKAARSF